ncbi:lipoyl(octanoyl) transferase LipB [Acuticoccus sp.]|uniref:lipoyl(octanoyl) transferase LipB n=1 Tax=Acuticoccus sp. TaxID=1904378 RepID=UPI003B525EC6
MNASSTDPAARDRRPVDWAISDGLTDYDAAVRAMDARSTQVAEGGPECVWLLEHPALYTAGTSADPADLKDPGRLPVVRVGRGGQYTYHGPGQRIAYLMLDLRDRGRDVRAYVHALEGWVIDALAAFNVDGERREGRVGVWVRRPGGSGEAKIAAIGVRVRRWVTLHGVALNVEPDLSHYAGIVPCGVREHGVTSLADLGRIVTMEEVDAALREAFQDRFGRVRGAVPPLAVETA